MTAWKRLQQKILTTEQIRRVDLRAIEDYGMHSLVLMENAALGCVHWIAETFPQPAEVVLLCGRGNNGGDGLVISRHLRLLGWKCHVHVLGPVDQLSPDAFANWKILEASGEQVTLWEPDQEHTPLLSELTNQVGKADVILDCMLGTGASGAPRGPYANWIEATQKAARAFRIAIDIPTGVDSESGQAFEPAFRPDATLTFVARKPAMASHQPSAKPQACEAGEGAGQPTAETSSSLFGEICVLPIGVPEHLVLRTLADLEMELDTPELNGVGADDAEEDLA